MILHIPGRGHPLIDYGISIPVASDRVSRILEALKNDSRIAAREAEWLIGHNGCTIEKEDVLRAHSPEYVERLYSADVESAVIAAFELVDESGRYHRYKPERAIRPLDDLFQGTLRNIAGTYQCCGEALDREFCFYFGGGAHHAHADFGHGFCILNDSVVALRRLQAESRVGKTWVIDVDAHKGDGTATLARGDDSIITLSAHMARGWPLDGRPVRKDGTPNPSFVASDIDVPVDIGEEDKYLPRLEAALAELAGYPKPDLAVVLLGADVYEHDGLPSTRRLQLTLDQMTKRDMMIYRFLSEHGIPQAYLMAGGYADRSWEPYPPFLTDVIAERIG